MKTSRFSFASGLFVIISLASVLTCPPPTPGQVPISTSGPYGMVRLFGSDAAILEVEEPRKDLPCTVTPDKALLGFDLRLHAGYEVAVPLKDLAGNENLLTIVFRVTPIGREEEPVYFSQRVRVPTIEEGAKGDAYLQGTFDLGEGKYHVAWLMRDRAERVCSSYWDVDASLAARDKDIAMVIPPGIVQATEFEPFKDEPPVERTQEESPLAVKVLVNFAPQNMHSAALQPVDVSALVSILRSIVREPRIAKFSLVAFNLQEQRVVYRQEDADRINFPQLGEAIESLNLGTVDLKRLSRRDGEAQFLADLIREETTGERPPDALIFAGPKAMLDTNVAEKSLVELGQLDYPVFYMNYNLNPQFNPWRDAIGHAVKFFKGTEFTISRPRDLWFAVTDMVSRIVKSKNERRTAAASAK